MLINESKKNGIKYLELLGRIEGDTSGFEKELLEIVENETKIVVDCEKLNFINSSGLRVFLTTMKTVTNNKGQIVLCNLIKPIADIFKISGLANVFKIYPTIAEAENSLS